MFSMSSHHPEITISLVKTCILEFESGSVFSLWISIYHSETSCCKRVSSTVSASSLSRSGSDFGSYIMPELRKVRHLVCAPWQGAVYVLESVCMQASPPFRLCPSCGQSTRTSLHINTMHIRSSQNLAWEGRGMKKCQNKLYCLIFFLFNKF